MPFLGSYIVATTRKETWCSHCKETIPVDSFYTGYVRKVKKEDKVFPVTFRFCSSKCSWENALIQFENMASRTKESRAKVLGNNRPKRVKKTYPDGMEKLLDRSYAYCNLLKNTLKTGDKKAIDTHRGRLGRLYLKMLEIDPEFKLSKPWGIRDDYTGYTVEILLKKEHATDLKKISEVLLGPLELRKHPDLRQRGTEEGVEEIPVD